MTNKNKELLLEFTAETTLHGVNNIVKPKQNVVKRVVWLLLVLGMLALLLYYFIGGIQRYLNHPIISQISVVSNRELTFPAITICNNNRIRASYLKQHPIVELVYGVISGVREYSSVNFSDPVMKKKMDAIHLNQVYSQGGHQLEDMFQLCYWNSINVNCSEYFTGFFADEGGFCYTFNHNGNFKTRRNGPNYAFEVYIDIQQIEYSLYAQSPGAGVRFLVHDHRSLPTLASGSYSVSAGSSSEVQLKSRQDLRLPYPFQGTGCYNGTDYFNQQECLTICIFRYISSQCNCIPAQGYTLSAREKLLRNCTLSDFYPCVGESAVDTWQNDSIINKCGCLHHCQEISYDVKLSGMRYPSYYTADLWNKNFLLNTSHLYEHSRENFMHIKFYFESMLTTTIKEIPAYTFANFAAEIGGYLGLFLGASLLTIGEILDFVFQSVLSKCSPEARKRKQDHNPA